MFTLFFFSGAFLRPKLASFGLETSIERSASKFPIQWCVCHLCATSGSDFMFIFVSNTAHRKHAMSHRTAMCNVNVTPQGVANVLAKWTPKEPKDAQRAPKERPKAPKGAQRVPKGCPKSANGAQRAPKTSPFGGGRRHVAEGL